MPVPEWQPGTLYFPGDTVRPTGQGDVSQSMPANPDFEAGDTGWTFSGQGSFTIDQDPPVFAGTWSAKAGVTSNPNGGVGTLTNDTFIPITPGQVVTARCFARALNSQSDPSRLQFKIQWYNATMGPLTFQGLPLNSQIVGGETHTTAGGIISFPLRDIWYPLEVTGVAPAGAAFFKIIFDFGWNDDAFYLDEITLDFANQAAPNTLLFRATQSESGFSDSTEPDWPTMVSQTVVDNEVTWTAVAGNNITWEANRILVSGSAEPTFPVMAQSSVVDATIVWELDTRRVRDDNVPQSTLALIGASKVFSPDGDTINFSATVNPLDWTTPEDAGYLPFGLQEYGANDVTAMALYRGNVVAFNTQGVQIWQIDEDPAGMSFLDAIPVSCRWPKSVQPVGDDLAFLSDVGIRSLGVAGAAVNLQGGYFGKQVDPIAKQFVTDAVANGFTPRGIYWPAWGQYWLVVDDTALVLTMNGNKVGDRSWSLYTFPAAIDDWTILADDLYLRAGNLIWKVDPEALLDDQRCPPETAEVLIGAGEDPFAPWLGYGAFEAQEASFGAVVESELDVHMVGAMYWSDDSGSTWNFSILLDTASGAGIPPPADTFESVAFTADSGPVVFHVSDATIDTVDTMFDAAIPEVRRWTWPVADRDMSGSNNYVFTMTLDSNPATCAVPLGEDIQGVVQWPHLDLNRPGYDKELVELDLVMDGTADISIGYDQTDQDYSVGGAWTPAYTVAGDTLPGQPIPIGITAGSHALRVAFAPNQAWELTAANLYIDDTDVR